MGWAKDLLFLGGYLSPAVLAEEIEIERAAQAAAASRPTGVPAARTAVESVAPGRVAGAANAPVRPCP